ncbi:CAP domain-containing protein [Nonomuraea angiospora]|uniref:CAP domain-containing protein n=1 Tax=Nonomuraea angiospora TaxID=46172 RepID=UPI00332DD89C
MHGLAGEAFELADEHHPQLHRAARGHSADMAEDNYFSNTSRDGRSFTDRIKEAGFTGGTSLAENIAKGPRTPAAVVQSWMSNSGTKATILNCRFTSIGVDAVEDSNGAISWTQDPAAKLRPGGCSGYIVLPVRSAEREVSM